MPFTEEQKNKALQLYDETGSIAKVIHTLGYPSRQNMYPWIKIWIIYKGSRCLLSNQAWRKDLSSFKPAYLNSDLSEIGKLCLDGIFQVPGMSRNKPSMLYQTQYYNSIFMWFKFRLLKFVKNYCILIFILELFSKTF